MLTDNDVVHALGQPRLGIWCKKYLKCTLHGRKIGKKDGQAICRECGNATHLIFDDTPYRTKYAESTT